jgi:hypothetical protein
LFFLLGVLNFGLRKQREEEKMGNGVRFDVDEAQLHVVFGVVGSLCLCGVDLLMSLAQPRRFGSRLAEWGDAENTVALFIIHTSLS